MRANDLSQNANVMSRVNLEDIYTQQVFDYYRQRFLENEDKQAFVQQSPRIPNELRTHTFIGLCDRKLGLEIGGQRSLEGGAIRGSMKRMGLFPMTGGELFRSCVVFPEFNEHGTIISAIGYRYGERIRRWQRPVIQWTKPEPEFYVTKSMKLLEEIAHAKAYH